MVAGSAATKRVVPHMSDSNGDGSDQGGDSLTVFTEEIMAKRRSGNQKGQSSKPEQGDQPTLMLPAAYGESNEAEWDNQP